MSFETAAYLGRATSRAKSDVANKMVSMFLHALSRRLNTILEVSVTDPAYVKAVEQAFGATCCYCERVLENDRASVEHLDGMNRFRAGLHIAGNVIVSCKQCNGEKRRDDQLRDLELANSGWESFLSHDSTKCDSSCNTCRYWRTVFPPDVERVLRLKATRDRITQFRSAYSQACEIGLGARPVLRETLDSIYRECQEFATSKISESVDAVFEKLHTNPQIHLGHDVRPAS